MAALDPGLPQLTGRLRSFHPFRCSVHGCEWLRVWVNAHCCVVGWCDEHRERAHRDDVLIPISIYGREQEGWSPYPMTLARYFTLVDAGAFDANGNTRAYETWAARDPHAARSQA